MEEKMQFVDEIYPAAGEQQQHENNAYISSDSANFGRSQRPTFVRVHPPSPQQSPTGSSNMRSASMQNANGITTGSANGMVVETSSGNGKFGNSIDIGGGAFAGKKIPAIYIPIPSVTALILKPVAPDEALNPVNSANVFHQQPLENTVHMGNGGRTSTGAFIGNRQGFPPSGTGGSGHRKVSPEVFARFLAHNIGTQFVAANYLGDTGTATNLKHQQQTSSTDGAEANERKLAAEVDDLLASLDQQQHGAGVDEPQKSRPINTNEENVANNGGDGRMWSGISGGHFYVFFQILSQ